MSFFVAMLVLDWSLTLRALIPVPFAMVLAWAAGRFIHQRTPAARQANGALTAGLQAQLSGLRVARPLGTKQAAPARLARPADAQTPTNLAGALPPAGTLGVSPTQLAADSLHWLWRDQIKP